MDGPLPNRSRLVCNLVNVFYIYILNTKIVIIIIYIYSILHISYNLPNRSHNIEGYIENILLTGIISINNKYLTYYHNHNTT